MLWRFHTVIFGHPGEADAPTVGRCSQLHDDFELPFPVRACTDSDHADQSMIKNWLSGVDRLGEQQADGEQEQIGTPCAREGVVKEFFVGVA